MRLPQTGQTGWGARVVASERARKEGRGCLGRVKCYRSERVRRSGDSSAAPRERLAGRAVDTRSHQISGKKKARGAGVGDSLSVCGDDEGREGRRNGPYMLEIRFVDEGGERVCASRFEAWLLYVPNNLPSVFLI